MKKKFKETSLNSLSIVFFFRNRYLPVCRKIDPCLIFIVFVGQVSCTAPAYIHIVQFAMC